MILVHWAASTKRHSRITTKLKDCKIVCYYSHFKWQIHLKNKNTSWKWEYLKERYLTQSSTFKVMDYKKTTKTALIICDIPDITDWGFCIKIYNLWYLNDILMIIFLDMVCYFGNLLVCNTINFTNIIIRETNSFYIPNFWFT